jgi:capsule biosynthesis phosphatase
MLIIILCGGAGTRFNNVFPKPLNLVAGVPMIYHVVSKINVNKITFIYNKILDEYGFCQYLLNTFSNIIFNFIPIDFQTRGPAETLFTGLSKISITELNEQVVVLDNDNIYQDINWSGLPRGNFIFYSTNKTGLEHYSFISIENDNVLNIEEKRPISNDICVGGYGFQSVTLCIDYCKKVIMCNMEDEPYLSKVMKKIICDGHKVSGYYTEHTFSIGTREDIIANWMKMSSIPLRVVFDLDNTVVSYPHTYKDYTNVSPVHHTIQLIKYLKSQGHTIIIYTARNMVRSGNNIGKIIKNIGKTTIETLENFGIEYDELYFGKPYGDLYIDDKAFNTFDINLLESIGFYNKDINMFLNSYRTNKYNSIIRINKEQIRKIGSNLEGEISFYKNIENILNISKFFPKMSTYNEDYTSFVLEYINGTPLANIYVENLLQPSLMKELLLNVLTLHTSCNDKAYTSITLEDIKHHYIDKLVSRSQNRNDFPFKDFEDVYRIVRNQTDFFISCNYPINSIIHGDLWFSNIMYYKNNFIFYDMRGKVADKVTTEGHILYDYAKLYQSIIGLDSIILYDKHIDIQVKEPIEKVFWEFLYDQKIISMEETSILIRLTGYLIFNTFHSYKVDFPLSKKDKIWELVKMCISH